MFVKFCFYDFLLESNRILKLTVLPKNFWYNLCKQTYHQNCGVIIFGCIPFLRVLAQILVKYKQPPSEYVCVFTQSLCHELGVTQGQFLSRV